MSEAKTIRDVPSMGLCMGCGVCAAACSAGAIQIVRDDRRGEYRPVSDESRCTECGVCVAVCAGLEVNFPQLAEHFLGREPTCGGEMVGPHRACYFAHACDEQIRYRSASGGLVTALLIYALEQDLIDAALVVGTSREDPLEPRAFLAETPEQVIEAGGSKYCPSTIAEPLREVLQRDGRFAVVGLPCEIHSVRKLEVLRPKLRKKVLLHFGIFCANNSTFLGTQYFLRCHRIDPAEVAEIRYRDKGWPGWITVGLRDGSRREFRRGTTETSPRNLGIMQSAFQTDFVMPRCLLCPDLFAELADISFGDPWSREFLQSERVGKSLIIARTEAADALLRRAADEGVIELSPTNAEKAMKCQHTGRKATVGAMLELRRRRRRPVPLYPGRPLPFQRRDLMRHRRYVMSYHTWRRWTWPLLSPLRKVWWLQALPGRVVGKLRRTLGSTG